MDCFWIKITPSLSKGIAVLNQLDDSRFEQFLRRIVLKIRYHGSEIFSEDEIEKLVKIFQVVEENLHMAIKTVVYLVKRLTKYIFMPINLKNDLKSIGINNEKADHIVKLWSSETKSTLDELDSVAIEKNSHALDFSWYLNAELSSDYCKKTKVPKAYLTLGKDKEALDIEIEMTHPELYTMYLQFEGIQNELDNIL